ncbi:hypothetical protein QBC47DRAFT_352744 [Echria macrotheca]|uniref:BRCT domain-containing protein n=1 Tax=Echria macrotheca TaxID=438768 RepID=A0AAJ0F107_9PEZI|nr:hypothetical protein QBC47DRAFT_352744 [Echria macrotheca]
MPSSLTTKPKPIFKSLVLSITGSLGGQWTEPNITRWVTLRGGTVSPIFSESVTHLICSDEEFKRRGSLVRAALRRGDKKCKVVTRDWLEDCMSRNKLLPVKEYSLAEKIRRENARKRREMAVVRGMEIGERGVNPNFYHHYHDLIFFRYEVTISREEDGARYILSLYESNAKPHMYWFCAKFYKRKGDAQPNYYRPSGTPGSFWREFGAFEAFFEKKTGVRWERRLLGNAVAVVGDGGEGMERLFRYLPPTGGKPVGFVPAEFIPRLERAAETNQTVEAVNSLQSVQSAPSAQSVQSVQPDQAVQSVHLIQSCKSVESVQWTRTRPPPATTPRISGARSRTSWA